MKYNTTHFVFLTWYQSHCSNFLVSCSLILLVFSATSTSVVSKSFHCPLSTAPPPSEVLRVESPPPESSSSVAKTTCIIGSVTFDLRLGHKIYHRVDFHRSTHSRRKNPPLTINVPVKVWQIIPRASRATRVAPILLPLTPLKSSFSDLHFRERIGFIGRSTHPHAPP